MQSSFPRPSYMTNLSWPIGIQ